MRKLIASLSCALSSGILLADAVPEGSAAGTNTTSTVTAKVCRELGQQVGQGRELMDQVLTWLADKGLTFAINVISALVILVIGWIAIKLIVAAVSRAVAKAKRGNTLFGNFMCNATAKIC